MVASGVGGADCMVIRPDDGHRSPKLFWSMTALTISAGTKVARDSCSGESSASSSARLSW